jgi:hypothetical protein
MSLVAGVDGVPGGRVVAVVASGRVERSVCADATAVQPGAVVPG